MAVTLGILFLLSIANVYGKAVNKRSNVCYGDLGCFSTSAPFFSLQRPINFLPKSASAMKIRFLLYTRQNRDSVYYLDVDDFSSIEHSHFVGTNPTKFVSHGFLENGFVTWMKEMKNEFLIKGDYNVILVDWGGGSGLPYTQATANTRVVGAQIAKLIKNLQVHGGAKPQDIHIIGHSLGSHIAGYAGERTPNLGRITGMDPAGPYFENTDKIVRLDPTDAMFVDAIHTDGESLLTLGFGMKQPVGHADYYPNGGHNQPGCEKGIVDQIRLEGDLYNGGKEYVACNHLRSYHYFTESINSRCPFTAFRCQDYDSFEKGLCTSCTGDSCGQMGFYADQHKVARSVNVKYFLDTSNQSPFCRYHYHVKVSMGNPLGSHSWRGTMYVTIHGTNGNIADEALGTSPTYFVPGQTFSFMIHSQRDIGAVKDITVHWHHQSTMLNPFQWNPFGVRHPTLSIARIHVSRASNQVNFCPSGSGGLIETDSQLTMTVKC